MRLVFMGTPHFVVPVLDALTAQTDVELAGVYTTPDRPRGRGRFQEMTPVKAFALERGLKVLQPTTLRSAASLQELSSLSPDVIVVAAYGRILPTPVLELPPHGCLNLHPSLLPRYRGPSPVVTAIRDGGPVTGTTLMLLDEGMDTGPIIAQREQSIGPEDTAESLTTDLFQLGGELLLESLTPWVNGELEEVPQDDTLATVTSKLERADGETNWQLSARELELRQRAFTPWPGLFTNWQGQVLKLIKVVALPDQDRPNGGPGSVVRLEDTEAPVGVVTGQGILGLKVVQLEGRRSTSTQEFVRGYPSFVGSRL